MKKAILLIVAVSILLVFGFGLVRASEGTVEVADATEKLKSGDNQLSVSEILAKVDEAETVKSSKGILRQTITTTGGSKRILVMESYSKDGKDKQLTKYIKPARVKGEAILMLNDGDDIWYYSPRTDRVRKIASHAKKKKVMGSDFTYEDMGSGKLAEQYTGRLLGEVKEAKEKCYYLELIPTSDGPSYSKIQIWVGKSDFLTRRIDYWDKGEKPYKRLIVSEIKEIDGRLTAMKYRMKNLREGSETLMEILEIEYDVDLPDTMFTERNLKRR